MRHSGRVSRTRGAILVIAVSMSMLATALAPARASDSAALAAGVSITTPALAEIPMTSCSVSEAIDLTTQTRLATCINVPLHLDPTAVTLQSPEQPGLGTLFEKINLSSALVRTKIGGLWVSQTAYQASDPNWAPKQKQVWYRLDSPSTGTVTLQVPEHNDAIGTLTTWVPATWSQAWLQMGPVSADVSSPCTDSSSNCSSVPLLNAPWTWWEPPISESHYSTCDSVLMHHESIKLNPSSGSIDVAVSVDNSRLTVSDISMLYSVDGGAPHAVAKTGTSGNTYTFSIQSGDVPEGSRLAYAFLAHGVFSDAICQGLTAAVQPTNHSFLSAVASDPNAEGKFLREVATDAAAAAADQPGLTLASSLDSVCSSAFFGAENPCNMFPSATSTSSTGLVTNGRIELGMTTQPPSGSAASATSSTGKICTIKEGTSAGWTYDFSSSVHQDNSGSIVVLTQGRPYGDDGAGTSFLTTNAVLQYTYAEQRLLVGEADQTGDAEVGWAFVVASGAATAHVKVELQWDFSGHLFADAGPRTCPTLLFFLCLGQQADSFTTRDLKGRIYDVTSTTRTIDDRYLANENNVSASLGELLDTSSEQLPDVEKGSGTYTYPSLTISANKAFAVTALLHEASSANTTFVGTRAYSYGDYNNDTASNRYTYGDYSWLHTPQLRLTITDTGTYWAQCDGTIS